MKKPEYKIGDLVILEPPHRNGHKFRIITGKKKCEHNCSFCDGYLYTLQILGKFEQSLTPSCWSYKTKRAFKKYGKSDKYSLMKLHKLREKILEGINNGNA